jgi:hypothetical protein
MGEFMQIAAAVTAGTLALTFASSAFALSASQGEYMRGYNNCLAGRYDREQHGAAYKRGCRAVVGRRPTAEAWPPGLSEANRNKYRGCESGPASRSRIRAHVYAGFSDLKGMDSIKAFHAMTSKGFHNVGTIMSGKMIYGIYYNPLTRQCVQLANAHGRVLDARDIGAHPKCK